VVDNSSDQDSTKLERAVEELRRQTLALYHGQACDEPAFRAFREVALRYGIPREYALELIEGMAMDARAERYETLADLELYAYRVAGVVGLMMTHVLRAQDPRAAYHAKQLGIAMQLTNISRDVLEDARLGRLYLPLAWLREAGLSPENFTAPENRARLASVTARLVTAAEGYYDDGNRGLKYLRLRPALAIAAASGIYRAIGHLVVRRGAGAWDSRAVISLPAKLWQMFVSIVRMRRLA
jgi:phytoene synthase